MVVGGKCPKDKYVEMGGTTPEPVELYKSHNCLLAAGKNSISIVYHEVPGSVQLFKRRYK